MKNKGAELSKLKTKTAKDLELIKNKLQTINSPEELINALNAMSDFGEQTIEEYIPSGNIDLVNSFQKEIAELYDATLKIVEKPSFAEFSAFKSFIESMKESWLRKVESSKEEIARNYIEKGYKSREKRDYQETLACFNKALEIRPKDPRNWFERGNLLFDTGDFFRAIRDYKMVLEFDPGNPNALCNIGLVLYSLNRFSDSLEYFEKTLQIDPNYVQALVGMGNSYFRLEKFNVAKEVLEKALRLNPNNVDANLAMGSLMHDGFYEIEEARKYAEKALSLDGDNIVAKANLAEALLAFGKYEKSSSYAFEVLEEGPEPLGYPMRLVIVCSLYFRKRFEEAAKAALDLVEYYETMHDNIVIIWKFHGLRRTIANNKQITDEDVPYLLNHLIDLAENPDVYAKNRLLQELPMMIESVYAGGGYVGRPIHVSEKELKLTPEKEIIVKNTSKPDRFRRGYYKWAIFLTPEDALDEVEKVVYTLHETFPNRFREVRDRNTGFRLKSKGWGEFQVKVEIYLMNRDEPLVKYHWLKLGSRSGKAS